MLKTFSDKKVPVTGKKWNITLQ